MQNQNLNSDMESRSAFPTRVMARVGRIVAEKLTAGIALAAGFAFCILGIVYAATALNSPTPQQAGDVLTADNWNSVVNQVKSWVRDSDSADSNIHLGTSGKVGIGTTTPSEKLEVDGAIRTTKNALDWSAKSGAVMDYHATDTSKNARFVGAGKTGENVGMEFWTTNNGTLTNALNITPDGLIKNPYAVPYVGEAIWGINDFSFCDTPTNCDSFIPANKYNVINANDKLANVTVSNNCTWDNTGTDCWMTMTFPTIGYFEVNVQLGHNHGAGYSLIRGFIDQHLFLNDSKKTTAKILNYKQAADREFSWDIPIADEDASAEKTWIVKVTEPNQKITFQPKIQLNGFGGTGVNHRFIFHVIVQMLSPL